MSELHEPSGPIDGDPAVGGPAPGSPAVDGEDVLVAGRARWRVVRPRAAEPTRQPGRHLAAAGVPGQNRRRLPALARDAGMATAEYAIATLAAVGFAGLLVVILKSNEVRGLLTGIVRQALTL